VRSAALGLRARRPLATGASSRTARRACARAAPVPGSIRPINLRSKTMVRDARKTAVLLSPALRHDLLLTIDSSSVVQIYLVVMLIARPTTSGDPNLPTDWYNASFGYPYDEGPGRGTPR
jgi:hypothetical protein